MRHRKFQKNNKRTGVKAVSRKKQTKSSKEGAKKLNQAPNAQDLDQQRAPKAYRLDERRDEQKWLEQKHKRNVQKNKKQDDKTVEGFERRDYESDWQFWHRVCRETDTYVQERLMKIKFEIPSKSDEKVPEPPKRKQTDPTELSSKEKRLFDKASTSEEQPKSKKMKRKQKEKEINEQNEEQEEERYPVDLLNAREVIEFGDRVDAPPQFTGNVAKSFKTAKTVGKRDLLLHNLVGVKHKEKKKKMKVTSDERQKVIDAYRANKAKRTIDSEITL